VRPKSSIGLEPRKRLLSKVIWPHYETYPNQNRSNVLRQESEGEVTQGETAGLDRSDRFILSLLRACLEHVERPVEGPAGKLILFDKGVQID